MDKIWEFDCPQFVDFTQPLEHDDNADHYFNFDHENDGIPVDLGSFNSSSNLSALQNEQSGMMKPDNAGQPATPTKNEQSGMMTLDNAGQPATPTKTSPAYTKETPRRGRSAQKPAQHQSSTENGKDEQPDDSGITSPESGIGTEEISRKKAEESIDEIKILPNVCTSVSKWKLRGHIHRDDEKSSLNKKPALRRQNSMETLKMKTKRPVPPPRLRSSSSDRVAKPTTNLKRCNSMDRCHIAGKGKETEKSHQAVPLLKPRMTIPVTPMCLKRLQKMGGPKKTAEQMELDKIQALRQELARKRKMAEESLKKSKGSEAYIAPHSAVPLTKPDQFSFETDKRLKNHDMETRQDAVDRDFVASLRNNKDTPREYSTAQGGITKPHPFHFADRKRKHDDQSKTEGQEKYKSMAEQVISYSSKTPERFRSKPANIGCSPPKQRKPATTDRITIPKTPSLETKARSRPITVKSHDQLEEEEVEDMKRYKFRAQPLNTQMMKEPYLKKQPAKESTVPECFNLETEKRPHDRGAHSRSLEEKEHYEFHAQPIPSKILEGTVGIKPPKDIPLTIPESPAFALKNRVRAPRVEVAPELKHPSKLKVLHISMTPFEPKIEHKVTETEPFSFQDKTDQMLKQKEEKIQKMLEDERKTRTFKANPLPDPHRDPLPPCKTKPVTKPAPFNLEGETRGAIRADEWSHKIEEELRQQRAMASFKATPCTVIQKDPFLPKKSSRPLTDVNDFELNSERRAEERAEWDSWMKQKEMEAEKERLAREKLQQEVEEREVRLLRSQIVHKSNPVRKYKTVDVHRSEKPLTDPHTPKFSERLRSKNVRF